jgi:hypothetical protein
MVADFRDIYRLSLLFAYYGVVFRITTRFGFGVGNITIVADLIAAASAIDSWPRPTQGSL